MTRFGISPSRTGSRTTGAEPMIPHESCWFGGSRTTPTNHKVRGSAPFIGGQNPNHEPPNRARQWGAPKALPREAMNRFRLFALGTGSGTRYAEPRNQHESRRFRGSGTAIGNRWFQGSAPYRGGNQEPEPRRERGWPGSVYVLAEELGVDKAHAVAACRVLEAAGFLASQPERVDEHTGEVTPGGWAPRDPALLRAGVDEPWA